MSDPVSRFTRCHVLIVTFLNMMMNIYRETMKATPVMDIRSKSFIRDVLSSGSVSIVDGSLTVTVIAE